MEEEREGKERDSTSGRRACESAVLSSQTLKHHLQMCLKLVGMMYGHHEARRDKEEASDQEYLTVVMMNSALLKALHVVDSFQAFLLEEQPNLRPLVSGDHLVSFDGTLTTIYEGEDAESSKDRSEVPTVTSPDAVQVSSSLKAACEPEAEGAGAGGPSREQIHQIEAILKLAETVGKDPALRIEGSTKAD